MTLAGKTMTRATRRGAVAKVQVVPAEKRAIIGERADAPPRQASSTPAGESAPADEPARTEVMTTPAEIVDSFVENRNTSARRRSADLQQTAAWTENTITTAKETVPLADNMASPGDRTAPRTGSTATPTTKIKRVTFAEDVVGGDASMRHGQESDKPRWADNPTRVKCKTCRKWRRLPNGVNRRPSQSSCACRMRTLGSDEATCRRQPKSNEALLHHRSSTTTRIMHKGQTFWVRCSHCQKWRALIPGMDPYDIVDDDKQFFCAMNGWDLTVASCMAPEQSQEDQDKQWNTARQPESSPELCMVWAVSLLRDFRELPSGQHRSV